MWSAVSASARGGSGRQDRYRPSDLVIPGAGTSEERAVSPTRARLQGRINALMAQRYLEAAASGGTVLGAPAGGQKMMSNLSGMELVQVALKQVEHGEKGLADPWGRQVDSAGRPGSHGSQAAVDEVDLETEEEREARLEVERRQARLVRALTTLLVTGRERNPMPYMTLSVTDGLSQLPSAATSRMPSRNASIAWSRAASSRLQSAHAMVRSRRQSHAPEEDPGHLRLVSVTSSTHPVSLGDQVLGATSPHASDAGCPAPKTLQPSTLPNKPERHVRMRLGVGEPGHAASPSQRNSHVGDEGKKSAPHSPGRQPLAGDSQPALPHPPRRPKDAVGASSQPAATTQPQQSGPGQPRAPSVAGSEGARAPLPADLATVMRYHGDMLSRGTALTGIGAWEPPDPDVEESLEEAARVAEEGGLDFEELLEFVAHLDSVNQEFKLVDAARDRSRRVEAMLASAPGAAGGRGDSPRRGMAASGELPGAGVNTTVMHLLTKRRDGRVSNVTQLLNSYSAMAPSQATSSDSQPLQQQQPAQPSGLPSLPAGSPQLGAGGGAGGGVDLEALLGAISEALSTDLADMANQATRFDETFRLRTEQYLSALCRLNPAAFEETSAAQAEADYRSSVERAKLRLRQLHGEVEGDMLTSAGKPKNQYEKAVAMLQSNRPYFLPPMFTKERAQRAPVSPSAGEKAAPRPAWDVHASIFRERKKCDARDVVDTPSVLAKQFDLDWSRVVSKMLFMKLVAREDQGVRGKGGRLALEQELAEVRQELLAAFPLIRSAFVYFSISPTVDTYVAACERAAAVAIADGRSPEAAAAEVAEAAATATAVIMAGGAARSASPSRHELLRSDSSSPPPPPPPPVSESIATARAAVASLAAAKPAVPSAGYAFFEMDESHWLAFCCAVGVTSSNQAGVRVQDLRSLFWTVNKEEEKNLTLESVANSDYAYTRFEFMEALVRTAFARYIHGGMVTDGSDATKMLMQHLRGVLPPLALVDPNTFRREKLYTADMERAIVHNLELLTAAFKLFKARDKAKYMDISHWMSFVESNNLLAPHMGLTVTEARLVFAWSQTVVVDELKLRRRAVSLQLWDFIEAVARLADRIALPVTEEMDKWMLYNLNIGRNTPLPPGHTRVWTYCTALSRGKGPGLVRRASSSDLLAAATRPLAVKFRAFLDYLAGHMADQWGGSNTHETAQNMLRTASLLSGGVELA
ncbi:hypothetical protein HYH02_011034 [Chlamydomonas schloesseri]|uniref:Uncharacterized protein n=1 Tax=Chlamydomonas schloesseri TaxID=2026947 RepID=A0A835W537_9CHLO|nr:hypothetical protein HYH02_011034 [Chlamydomonas schloesseri]|eukprot:KAG2437653.1 hypothetical protein HYH02_011034 [Chlamydomonas schloesseri]